MDRKENEDQIREKGQGRINIDRRETAAGLKTGMERDISEIDRQEGDMEHGELGGNFNKPKEDNEK